METYRCQSRLVCTSRRDRTSFAPETVLFQLLRTNRRAKLFDCIDRIKPDGLCKIQKFNDINAPLATFDGSHKRLIAPQSFSELGLRQTRFLPLLNKQSD